MINQIIRDIDNHKEECIQSLLKLIELESSDGKSTKAQSFVADFLKELDFKVEEYSDLDPKVLDCPDYCPYDFKYHKDAYNVAGFKKGKDNRPSLLLFGHIDTEAEDYFGIKKEPYKAYIQDDKIYGLGASDDKGGIMMMLNALKYVNKYMTLPYDCTVLSILGKHGGAKGTLSSLMKGYRGDYGIYLHPAETGHGFAEIKNISLGVLDFDLYVYGKDPKAHDDLDPGLNATVLASEIVMKLEYYNQKMRQKYRFDFGSFKDEPSYILNVGHLEAGSSYGSVAKEAKISLRIRFYYPLSIEDVKKDLEDYLKNYENIKLVQGNFRANPAYVSSEDPFTKLIKANINKEIGIQDFIHQYHGGSDIRLPILYGDCKCIGIGPSCRLPLAGSGEDEWISIEDYLNGIKILARILYEFSEFGLKKEENILK